MEPAFFVSEFSSEVLSVLIKQCFGADFNDIKNKIQVKNIVSQLTALGARAIVCEREYVDKDYSDDYANYYVQSFKDYRGYCARLHFFSGKMDQNEFSAILDAQKDQHEALNSMYLGFVVIRPLPFAFLGKVCIKSQHLGRISRKYQASLFGIRLDVQSIAFQEQDRVVSACATTSVWSLLHALPEIHNKNIPSPSAITLAAFGAPFQNINSFPNKGLNLAQITTALDNFKLRQHSFSISSFDANEKNFLRKFVRCYIDSGIPVFIGAQIYKPLCPSISEGAAQYVFHGDHAVVATGMEINENGYSLIVHDDRLGPFIKVSLIQATVITGRLATVSASNPGTEFAFRIQGTDELLVPNTALVATYPKKKIGVEPIIRTAKQLLTSFKRDYLDNIELPGIFSGIGSELHSTSMLLECHDLKSAYFEMDRNASIRKVLVTNLPHFLWRIRVLIAGTPIIDFIFDATDTPNGNPYIQYVVLDLVVGAFFINGLETIAKNIREANEFDTIYQTINNQHIFSCHVDILRKLAPNAPTHKEFLTDAYGEIRSPHYFTDTKFLSYPPQILPGDSENRVRFYSALEVGGFNLQAYVSIEREAKPHIWVIDEEGALIMGPDTGHPNLTGANPARIAGEIWWDTTLACFRVNSKSGRYTKHYQSQDAERYLENAIQKWRELFSGERFLAA